MTHYNRWRKCGDPAAPVRIHGDDERRFLTKIRKTGTCWLWTGRIEPNGYAKFSLLGKKVWAHRWAYEHWVGVIPAGLTLDHLCRVPSCVRPEHLEPVTNAVNIARAAAAGAYRLNGGQHF